jgi:hypothetical protein
VPTIFALNASDGKKERPVHLSVARAFNLHLRDIVHLINTMREGSFRALTGCL